MKKLIDLLNEKKHTFSFELFPPKTEAGYRKLLGTIGELCKLDPDFISVTYGAGGGNRQKTLDIVEHIQKKHHRIGVAHLTCVLHTKNEIKNILDDIKYRGINNVLALRGDPPQEQPDWKPSPESFRYSCELCKFIRDTYGDFFGIGVAGFPEGHPLAPDKETDTKYLKAKIESGADYIITQFFFDNKDYFDYVERLKKLGVNAKVIPGILPITNYDGLLRFCNICGSTVTKKVHEIFEPIKDDPAATLKAGEEFAVAQCKDLLDKGAPGLHFYSLNKISPVDAILTAVRK